MKFGPFIAITIAAGALIGWFAPGAPDRAAEPPASSARDSAAQLDMLQQDQWLAGEVVLEREADGHFYADVEVDGATAHMLVDTGASVVALTDEDAEALGIAWDPGAVRPVARGASGAVHGVPVTIERMQLGGIEVAQVEAIVVPEGLGVSLLGQSFLSQIQRVEMNQGRMVLGG
jgi:aspartyl protease family protein